MVLKLYFYHDIPIGHSIIMGRCRPGYFLENTHDKERKGKEREGAGVGVRPKACRSVTQTHQLHDKR